MEAPDFWDNTELSQKKMKELKSLKDDVETYAHLSQQYEDIETLLEMGYEENDASLIPSLTSTNGSLYAFKVVLNWSNSTIVSPLSF